MRRVYEACYEARYERPYPSIMRLIHVVMGDARVIPGDA
jgi:hypothetical protein